MGSLVDDPVPHGFHWQPSRIRSARIQHNELAGKLRDIFCVWANAVRVLWQALAGAAAGIAGRYWSLPLALPYRLARTVVRRIVLRHLSSDSAPQCAYRTDAYRCGHAGIGQP